MRYALLDPILEVLARGGKIKRSDDMIILTSPLEAVFLGNKKT
jgi:hypothetical protein